MKIRIFDFCDTLVVGQTANNFIYFILDETDNTLIQKLIVGLTKAIPADIFNLKKKILLLAIRGIHRSKIESLSKKYSKTLSTNKKIYSIYKKSLINDVTIIASGGYHTYIKNFIKNSKVKILANEFEYNKNNKFTGFLKSKDCLGKEKSKRILKLKLNLKNSYFYSDSLTDLPSFKLVKYPYFFNNNKLKKLF